MLKLPNVTLACIDTSNYTLALHAMMSSKAKVEFGNNIWLTDEIPAAPFEINYKIIPTIKSLPDYSKFCIKGLNKHIKTDFVLLIQWDGYVVNPAMWSDEFLEYDYIGAPWTWREKQRVGNGGFSLRSKKLLEVLQREEFKMIPKLNEDQLICQEWERVLRRKHGIKIAPEEVASRFSFEPEMPETHSTFGFHGLFNFAVVMSEQKLRTLIPHIAAGKVKDPSYYSLMHNCAITGKYQAMLELARRCVEEDPDNELGIKAWMYAQDKARSRSPQ